MNITLISTATFPSDQGIRTISSVLKKAGHNVKIIFMSYSEDYSKFYKISELKQLFSLCRGSDLIGINSYTSTTSRAIQIIKFLKKANFQKPLVWGGIHATLFPEDCIKYVDIVCVGEGEEAILDLTKSLEENKKIDKIRNLWVRNNLTGKITKNDVRLTIENLDKIPFADYGIKTHFLLDSPSIRRFREDDLSGGIFFLTGRGCPYGCEYCSNNLFNELYKGKCKSIVRWHSVDYIIKCILYLKENYKSLSYFDIRDDTFSLRPLSQIKEFCDKYKEKIKMRFKCLADPKTISDEKIKLLVNAGCTDIIMGIQGSEKTNFEIFKRYQKDEDTIRSAKIFNKYKDKLVVMYDVITCNPYESSKEIISMIRLLQKLPKPYYLSINNLVFFPGTSLYNRAIQNSKLKAMVLKSEKLNYWDRAKHIKLKKKDMYLVLILNLMRGSVTEKRFGALPNFIINYLLKPKRVSYNLKNPSLTYLVLSLVEISDLIREKIAKPIYRAMPVNFKVWYDKIRYKV